MYTLYTLPGSCSTGTTILLEKLGVPFETVVRNDVPNYQELAPTNQVPALKTEAGQIITEGAAIALYLLEKHGKSLLPTDEATKAEFYQYLMFNYATLHPAYSRIFAARNVIDDAETQKDAMQKLADKTSATWAILDKRLEGRQYVVGNTPTIVDYLLAIYTGWAQFFPEQRIAYGKNVERLVAHIATLPEFKAAFAREGAVFQAA